ncbi:MAG: hypothetical protein BMS9Abin37_1075 [Acidobacteriota bacterium]|nr:MAG: hypothetical protein BMS9Abin37_1075 [Acidobacteriota bacterium]
MFSANAIAQTRAVEITPFVGYQAGGSASSFDGSLAILADVNYGVAVDVRVTPDTTLQFLYNRQETDVDIRINDIFETIRLQEGLVVDYYHLGGSVEFPRGRLRPYFAMTAGATRFDLAREGVRDEWRFSVGFGGGFKTYVSERFGFRVDARILPTFVNTNGGFFCSLPGGCLVSISSDFVVQANASFGVFFGF